MWAKRDENFRFYFSSLHSIEQTFFLSFCEQTIFSPKVPEQTIYFLLFAEQPFFPTDSNGPSLKAVKRTKYNSTITYQYVYITMYNTS